MKARTGSVLSSSLVLQACVIVGGIGVVSGGCTTYYKVTDPTTNRVYYTTELRHNDKSGTAILKDARTGNKVTIQNSEVEKITKQQFETGKATPPPQY